MKFSVFDLERNLTRFLRKSDKQQFFLSKLEKSHWLQVSVSKLQGDESVNMRMPNGLFEQNLQSKTERVNTTIEFCIFELILAPNLGLN